MTGTPRLSVSAYRRQMGLPPVEAAPRISSSPANPRGCTLPPAAAHRTAGAPSGDEQGPAASQVKAAPRWRGHSGHAGQGGQPIRTPRSPEHEAAIQAAFDGRRSVTIVIPGAPVAKARPRLGKGRTYTPEKTAAWERAAKASARAQWGPEPPLEGAVRVEMLVVLPVPKSWANARQADAHHGIKRPIGRPDLDNYIKAGLDALNEIAWRDDAQVVELSARKTYAGRPRVEIKVSAA